MIKEIWLQYQRHTGLGLDKIKRIRHFDLPMYTDENNNNFYWAEDVDQHGILEYLEWLEDQLEIAQNIKSIIFELGNDKINVEQAVKLLQKYSKV